MTYYPDLTPYEYGGVPTEEKLRSDMYRHGSEESRRRLFRYYAALRQAVNVGWLSKENDYVKGETSREFQQALSLVCMREAPPVFHRGYHYCEFCAPVREGHGAERLDGIEIPRGDQVIAFAGASRSYAFPSLIDHYVERHGYKPPDEFLEAVLAMAEHMTPIEEDPALQELGRLLDAMGMPNAFDGL